MLKYQVRTLGRKNDLTSDKKQRRSSTNQNASSSSYYSNSLRDVFENERSMINGGRNFSRAKIAEIDNENDHHPTTNLHIKNANHNLSRSISTASSSTNSSLNSSLTVDDESLDVFSSSASSINGQSWRHSSDQPTKFLGVSHGGRSLVNGRGRSTSVSSLSSSTSTNSEASVEWGYV
uniref:Uncharacterized protein n=1 Tax=Romanomermis culicivorax TaxID=13658 RepID=A0A915HK32_ROMCU